MPFSFVQSLVVTGAAGSSVKPDRSTAHATAATPGKSCARPQADYCWVESSLTSFAVGSSGPAPRSYKRLTAATPGINQSCRRLKNQLASVRHRLSIIETDGL